MHFARYSIHESLKKSLAENGFVKPTDIQYKAIPGILKGEDVLAVAQTGTGKTAAFVIPVMERLLRSGRRAESAQVRCLVMVPTRELAVQIDAVFKKLGRHTSLKFACIFGGVEQDKQTKELKKGVDVLVSTPGRMFDLRNQGFLGLEAVEILILDEADQMLAPGFIRDIRDTVKHLPRNRQTLFFSATIDEKIKDLAYSLVKNAIRIQISPKDKVSRNVRHSVAFIEMDDKRFFLEKLIRENQGERILVFVRTKVRADRVQAAMARVDIAAGIIHGGKNQADRQKELDNFRNASTGVLIATDVSARGIDIPGVRFVVNYDLPEEAENYVHRVGRTGRGVEKGSAVSFCSKEEIPLLEDVESYLGKKVEILQINKDDYQLTLAMSADRKTDFKNLIEKAKEELNMLNSVSKSRKKSGRL